MAKMALGRIGDRRTQIVLKANPPPEDQYEKVMEENHYILLLSKRLSGEINPKERTALDLWLQQSPENGQFAAEMERVWANSETYSPSFTPDLDAAYQQVQSRIKSEVPARLRVSYSQKLVRAAAVLMVLITATWAWQHFGTVPTPTLTVLATGNEPKQFELPDGSKIWLREGSQLRYAQLWDGEVRLVKLSGEGYFEVEHDPARPFKVELENGGSVEVLGTQFDVRQTPDQTSVLVRSGKVRFSPNGMTDGPILTANQKAVFDHSAAKVRVTQLSSLNELSWQTGGLTFVNTPLAQVIADLELYYGVKIELGNPDMLACPHSAPLTNQPIEKVLQTLALTHQLKMKKKAEKSFELNGGQCR